MTPTKRFPITCKKSGFLNENDRIRREQEDDLRKLRILQVREESKNLARKIREDVAAEKQKQLRTLERKKAQELNLWRDNMLHDKYNDYRDAIFQVGEAHRAAQEECRRQKALDALKKQQERQLQLQQKQQCKPTDCVQNNQNAVNIMANCNAHAGCSCQQNACLYRKRKRNPCAYNYHVPYCYNYTPYVTNDMMMNCCNYPCDGSIIDVNDSCDTDTLLNCNASDDEEQQVMANSAKSSKLCRTPTVCLEVENGAACMLPQQPSEINDRHVQNNRQFTRVVRKSPAKPNQPLAPKKTPFKKTIQKKTSIKTATPRKKVADTTVKSTAKSLAQPAATECAELPTSSCNAVAQEMQKQFTKITDYLREKELAAAAAAVNLAVASSPQKTQVRDETTAAKSAPASPQKIRKSSPQKQTRAPPASPTKTTTSASAKTVTAAESNTVMPSSSTSSSGRVQFFDYNSKQCKDALHTTVVQRESVFPSDEPNAMERANVERELQKAREEELDKLRKRSDERGQRALEREQVRRDAAELTAKLDALTREHPHLLPTEASIYANRRPGDLATRREQRVTSAVEELLMRPAIITCPEVNRKPNQNATAFVNRENGVRLLDSSINLAAPAAHAHAELTSSDSSHSILLGHVNNQTKQIRNDLQNYQQLDNKQKIDKLQALLERTNKLREMLMAELSRGVNNVNDKNMQEIMDFLSHVRKEREHLLAGEKVADSANVVKQRNGNKIKTNGNGEVRISRQDSNQPLEIIIKVQGASRTSLTNVFDMKAPLVKQNSYDSSSTAYKSLPAKVSNNLAAAQRATAARGRQRTQSLDPAVAQYVERLLVMSKESVTALGVSSSDIETPTSSIMNISTNVMMSPEHLERVQRFIDDNHSFVNELEESLQAQGKQKVSTEKDRPLKEVWKQRLLKESARGRTKDRAEKPTGSHKVVGNEAAYTAKHATATKQILEAENTLKRLSGGWKQKSTENEFEQSKSKSIERNQSKETATVRKNAAKPTIAAEQMNNEPSRTQATKVSDSKQSSSKKTEAEKEQCREEVEKNFERYAQLTENCTQRVAELTDLINKVRMEKDRLLAQALSTCSDTFPNSTEYLELPKEGIGNLHLNIDSEEDTNSRLLDSNLINDIMSSSSDAYPQTESAPLNKQKVIAASHDSGIAMSRPLTAMDQHADMFEPISHASSNSQRSRTRPPAYLKSRVSPELPTDEQFHELSTIIEVDTPANSRIQSTIPVQSLAERSSPSRAQRTMPAQSADERSSPNKAHTTTLAPSAAERSNSKRAYTTPPAYSAAERSSPSRAQRTTSAESADERSSPNKAYTTTLAPSAAKPSISKRAYTTTPAQSAAEQSSRKGTQRTFVQSSDELNSPTKAYTTTPEQNAAERKSPTRAYSPTPAQSAANRSRARRVQVTTPAQSAAEQISPRRAQRITPHTPSAFPTFEEYLFENNLNPCDLTPEVSAIVEHEFNELICALKLAQQNNDLIYEEFPSLTAYLHNLTTIFEDEFRSCTGNSSGNSIEEMLASMRLAQHKIKQFPNRREYMRQQGETTNTTGYFIDSASLENLSDTEQTKIESHTESLDIQAELRRRKIINSDYCATYPAPTNNQRLFSSTMQQNKQNTAHLFQEIMACESGIEKLSTSDNDDSAEFERELMNIGLQWPAAMRRKYKAAEALSSGSSPETNLPSTSRCRQFNCPVAQQCANNSVEAGQPLNLREFLTKELLKHVNTSSASSTTDETLRNQFLQSIIGSMTPRQTTTRTPTPRTNNNAGSSNTVGRKKTSTPVNSTNTNSQSDPTSTTTHLFSGESRLSSVAFQEQSSEHQQRQRQQHQNQQHQR